MNKKLYFDNNASTFVDPKVAEKMMQTLLECGGNPSSSHWAGQMARAELAKARREVADFFGADVNEIIFTSGGTEALNLLLKGFATGGHIISTAGEHAAVYNTLESLQGCEVTYLPLDESGSASPKDLEQAIQDDTRLLSVIAANNETGVKTDLEAFASIAKSRNVPLIVDAVGWVGKEPFPLYDGITAFTVSGHKIHAPKGVGMAFLRRGNKLSPFTHGGFHERGLRAGTENLPGIVGFAEALKLSCQDFEQMSALRDSLEKQILGLPLAKVNGTGPRICNTTNCAFEGIDGETLLMSLDVQGLAVSHGAACSTGALEPSRVLLAMGLGVKRAESSIRFSLSRFTTQEEVDQAAKIVLETVSRLTP